MSNHPPQISFRHARATDVRAIVELERLSFANPGEVLKERRVRYLAASPRCETFVAETDQGLLGWSSGFAWPRGQVPWGRVYAMAVHPDARGRRVGHRLLRHLVDSLRRRGAGPVFLEVRHGNVAAERLYQKLGFVACQELGDYYGRGLHAHRMVLSDEPFDAP